jgi:hypothetical protein
MPGSLKPLIDKGLESEEEKLKIWQEILIIIVQTIL